MPIKTKDCLIKKSLITSLTKALLITLFTRIDRSAHRVRIWQRDFSKRDTLYFIVNGHDKHKGFNVWML